MVNRCVGLTIVVETISLVNQSVRIETVASVIRIVRAVMFMIPMILKLDVTINLYQHTLHVNDTPRRLTVALVLTIMIVLPVRFVVDRTKRDTANVLPSIPPYMVNRMEKRAWKVQIVEMKSRLGHVSEVCVKSSPVKKETSVQRNPEVMKYHVSVG